MTLITDICPPIFLKNIKLSSELVTKANFPVAMAFAPDGRLFYNGFRTGNRRVFEDEATSVFAHVDVLNCIELGLLGLAIDPDFQDNHYIYIYFIEPVSGQPGIGHPVVMRYTDVNGRGEDPTVILNDLPSTTNVCAHVGGNIHFGPDGYLYVSVGDMQVWKPNQSQDIASLLGKILRLDKSDGSAAPGNPFEGQREANPLVFAYGLRNPFDFTFDHQTGQIYAPDNGMGNCDELNVILPASDYGHPVASFGESEPKCHDRTGKKPIYLYSKPNLNPETFASNVAPTGVHLIRGEVYPSLGNALLTCEFNTGYMRKLALTNRPPETIIDDSMVVRDCSLDVVADPTGVIYYSNLEEIRRLIPLE